MARRWKSNDVTEHRENTEEHQQHQHRGVPVRLTSQFTHRIFHVPNIQRTHMRLSGTATVDRFMRHAFTRLQFYRICSTIGFGIEYACVFCVFTFDRMCAAHCVCVCVYLQLSNEDEENNSMCSSANNNGELYTYLVTWEMQSRVRKTMADKRH